MAEYAYAPQEASVREVLRAKIVATWGVQKVYDDPQEVPDGPGSLPVAVILLMDTTPDEGEASMSHEAVRLEYQLQLREAKPSSLTVASSGRSLHAHKLARLDALRKALFAERRLGTTTGDWNHEWLGDSVIPRDNGEQEREVRNNWYAITMSIAVTVRFPVYR